MKQALWSLTTFSVLIGGCVQSTPQYSLTGGEQGVFHTQNAGRPIPVSQIKGMDEQQLQSTFGKAALDRKDAKTRVLRYESDGCSLFIYMQGDRASYADAYDPQLRPLMNADQCAGSVAAQRRSV